MKINEISRKLMIIALVLISSTFMFSCQKDEIQMPEIAGEKLMSLSSGLPYAIPTINTESNYTNVIYIDPSVSTGGNGSMSSPLKALPGTLQQNTAYLFKRGTTHGGINRLFTSVLLGAYGQGEKPIILGGLNIQSNSNNATIRDLDLARQYSGAGQFVVNFSHQNTSRNITIAFCKIRGIASGGIYPHYAIHHSAENLLLFNNEIFNIQNNGWWLSSRPNIRVIRNWIHNVNKGGENSSTSTGDGIQAEYGLNGIYFAGNIIDKTNSIWKYALMLNGTQTNNVFEYNTFLAPKTGAGGAGVRWMAHEGGIFRKNVVRSIDYNGNNLVGSFDTWGAHANKPEPYGIRDNHILRQNGTLSNVSTNGVTLHSSNTVFGSNAAYNTFLSNNPGIGLYGSDITAANFWASTESTPPATTYTVTFKIDNNQGNPISNAVVTFNGVTNAAGNYKFSNVTAGTHNYSVAATGHTTVSGQSSISKEVTIPVVLQLLSYPIQLSANPSAGGTLSGQGTYEHGQAVTVSATANAGYAFASWTENGSVVSTNASYNFTVNRSRSLVANFIQSTQTQSFQVNLSSNNLGCLFSGEGTYLEGQSVTVKAFPATGYQFVSWTENGTVVSNNASYNFTITKNRSLVANFAQTAQNQTFQVDLSSNNDGGLFSGQGTYQEGESVTVNAFAAAGYQFVSWTENGTVMSTKESYNFSITKNRSMVANFEATTISSPGNSGKEKSNNGKGPNKF